jgi:hypothetical protein
VVEITEIFYILDTLHDCLILQYGMRLKNIDSSNNLCSLAKEMVSVGSLRHSTKKLTHDCDLFRSLDSYRNLWSILSSAVFSE